MIIDNCIYCSSDLLEGKQPSRKSMVSTKPFSRSPSTSLPRLCLGMTAHAIADSYHFPITYFSFFTHKTIDRLKKPTQTHQEYAWMRQISFSFMQMHIQLHYIYDIIMRIAYLFILTSEMIDSCSMSVISYKEANGTWRKFPDHERKEKTHPWRAIAT